MSIFLRHHITTRRKLRSWQPSSSVLVASIVMVGFFATLCEFAMRRVSEWSIFTRAPKVFVLQVANATQEKQLRELDYRHRSDIVVAIEYS